jgi:sugar phosphate isomerase/epimerase
MPDFSCADFTFPMLDRRQAFSLLRLLSFHRVDLGLFERNDHVRTSTMLASQKRFTADILEDLDRTELSPADVFLQIGPDPHQASTNDPQARVRTENRAIFERALEFCSALGSKHLTGLPGVSHGNTERDFAYAVEETQWRVELCRAAGVTYAIEPHIRSICSDIASTQRLLNAVTGLTLTLDYGHFIAAGINSEEVHPLLPSASHLHIRGGAPGSLQTSLAENTIDFPAVLERLHTLNFDGVLSLEYVWIDWEGCNRSDTISETLLLRQAVQVIADSIQGKAGSHV